MGNKAEHNQNINLLRPREVERFDSSARPNFRATIGATAFVLALLASAPASAACTSPAGNGGDVVYGSNNVMAYCNGTTWVAMGTTSSVGFGTLTTGDFCQATSATQISCTTAAINLASQTTGVLPSANGGTGVNNGSYTITLGGNLTTSGAYGLTLTTTGTTNVTLPTSGTLLSTTGVGTITSGVWNGTAIGVGYGGTGSTSQTTNGVIYYDGTALTSGSGFVYSGGKVGIGTASPHAALEVSGSGYFSSNLVAGYGSGGEWGYSVGSGTVAMRGDASSNYLRFLTNSSERIRIDASGNVGIGTTTPGNTLTVKGTAAFMAGTDYTTTGAQSDVAINTAATMRYTGTAAATFYGIVAGTDGQVIHLHNASSYTLTLSNQSSSESTAANKIITGSGADLVMAANSSIILQYDITAARWRVIGGSGGGGTLAGLSDVTLTTPASGNLLTYNGSKWVNSTVASSVAAVVAPSFSVNNGATTQAVAAATWTKMTFGTAAFDTISGWSTANNRYTPTVAGKYLFNGMVACGYATGICVAGVYKNGSLSASGTQINFSSAPDATFTPVTAIVDMNGTTDYVELWGYSKAAASMGGVTTYHHFDGALLAPLASGSVAGTGTANYVPLWSSSTTLTNSAIAQSGSNVGIGTANPKAILHTFNATGVDPSLTYNSAAAAIINDGAVDLAMGTATSSPYAFWIQGRQLVNIAWPISLNPLGGNVGIGTISPTSILHTNSSAAKTASYTGVMHSVLDTSSTASINKIGLDIESTGSWTGTSAVNTGLVVNVSGGTTNYAATFTGGNVGVGTTTPGYPLTVYSAAATPLAVQNTAATAMSGINFVNSGGTIKALVGWNNASVGTNPNTMLMGTLSTQDLLLMANNAEVVRVASSGNVGIGTTAPAASLHVATGGLLAVTGTYGSGASLALSGAGTRMFFYPKKGAFRAGEADTTEWDDANIGDYSIAMGYAAKASGSESTAIGSWSIASGANNTAIGYGATASGNSSTAMGYGTTASGNGSTAMGYGTTASGANSTAMGYGTAASGAYSTAMGWGTTAGAFADFAIGEYNVGGGSPNSTVGTNPIFEIGIGFSSSNRANAVTVLQNGNVGIGTTTPGNTLTVKGTTSFMAGTDYTTTGAQADVAINTSSTMRYAGTASATFYGIVAGTDGQVIHLHNASSYTLTLSNQSASESTAANKIITGSGADLVMAANSSVIMQYDITAARWRVIGGSGGGGVSGTGTANTIPMWNSSTTLTNSAIAQSGSNVGIGTATPQATLDVNGFVKLGLNASAPVACSATTQGSLALTHLTRMCVCTTANVWSDVVTGAACAW